MLKLEQPALRVHHCSFATQFMASAADGEIDPFFRVVSASIGAVITSLAVTPLDVVKTRMQASTPTPTVKAGVSPAQCSRCYVYVLHTGIGESVMSKSSPCFGNHSFRTSLNIHTGVLNNMVSIARGDGVGALYSGLSTSLVMAVPATVLYFLFYEELRNTLKSRNIGNDAAPMIAGAAARTFSCVALSPLEVIRTRQYASPSTPSMGEVFKLLQAEGRGIRPFYRGLTATLFRDVPFSALYWVGYERVKEAVESKVLPIHDASTTSGLQRFTAPFVAGAISGGFAALVTTPFDVVKTRTQLKTYETKVSSGSKLGRARDVCSTISHNFQFFKELQSIYKEEGAASLFSGVVPRVTRIAPSCAIFIGSYELGKYVFGGRPRSSA